MTAGDQSSGAQRTFTVLDIPASGSSTPAKIAVELGATATVADLKRSIYQKANYPVENQQLTLRGQNLRDNEPLAELQISDKAMILLALNENPKVLALPPSTTAGSSYRNDTTASGAAAYGPHQNPSTNFSFSGSYGSSYGSGYGGSYGSSYGSSYGTGYGSGYGSSYGSGYSGYGSGYQQDTGRNQTGFVGLSNQGATCYMNSLIQSLYMTPEFRQAVYRWDFEAFFRGYLLELAKKEDDGKKKETPEEIRTRKEQHSIPLQLQKLFVRLQISDQRAVKTKDLTKSFGWGDEEAFTQHDVQELCRVLFDALEIAFKGTEQKDVINELYQGEMKDYVVCKNCGTESARTDKYLDIPLVIKGFGETKAVGSLEEAMEKFIQAETLDGSNQYQCEKCNKKVDAVKGLKFTSFPYILTIQLKRFDFDYETMRRIKLNDRVTFPKYLDLNPYVEGGEIASLRQSGQGLSESSDHDILDPNVRPVPTPDKPYYYELFAILIHRGSALGGHYYAYIKSFENDQFFEFNDSQVSPLDDADLEKAYGDKDEAPASNSWSGRVGTYSSMYKSSANAYMLMYRRIEPRNVSAVSESDIHPSVMDIIKRENEEAQRKREEAKAERSQKKIPIHYNDKEQTVVIKLDATIKDLREAAMKAFNVDLPAEQVRLRTWQTYTDMPGQPVTGSEDDTVDSHHWPVNKHLLLETREANQDWEVFNYDDVGVRLRYWKDGVLQPAVFLFLHRRATIGQLRDAIASKVGIAPDSQRLLKESYSYQGPAAELVKSRYDNEECRTHHILEGTKIFLEESSKSELDWSMDTSPLFQELVRLKNQIQVRFNKPGVLEYNQSVDIDRRESLGALRAKMAAHLGVEPDSFKIMRSQYAVTEMKDEEGASIVSYNLYDNRVFLEKGKPSKPGEWECKFHFYNPEAEGEKVTELWEYPVNENMTTAELKVALAKHWAADSTAPKQVDPTHLRIRESSQGRQPGKILRDKKTIRDGLRVRYAGMSFLVQILPGPDPVQRDTDLAIYIQPVEPANFALGKLTEVVVSSDMRLEDFKAFLEKEGYCKEPSLAKPPYTVTLHEVDILDVPDYEWDRPPNPMASVVGSLGGSPYYLSEGNMLIVKPKREEWKKLNAEEKAELEKQRKARAAASSSMSSYRYRHREEALKIQQDTD